MANISKINFNNTELTIKDAQARNDIISLSSKFPVQINEGGTGATSYTTAVKNLFNSGAINAPNNFLTISSNFENVGYTSINDTKSILGLGSAAYTNSIDYLSSSGGTVTNSINIKEDLYSLSTTSFTTFSGDLDRGFYIKDKFNKNLAYYLGRQSDNGNVTAKINARVYNSTGNTHYDNYIELGVNAATHEKTVSIDAPAWRTALGIGDSSWNSLTLNSNFVKGDTTNGGVFYTKYGGVATVIGLFLRIASVTTTTSAIPMATLPQNYKPQKQLYFPYNSIYLNPGLVHIATNGTISILRSRLATELPAQNFHFTCSYVV